MPTALRTSARQGSADTQHDFRFRFQLNGAVKRADLFVTGEDSAAAWVNGKQVHRDRAAASLEAGALEDLSPAGRYIGPALRRKSAGRRGHVVRNAIRQRNGFV